MLKCSYLLYPWLDYSNKKVFELAGDPNNLIVVMTILTVMVILYFRFKNIGKSKVVKGNGLIIFLPLIIILSLSPLIFQGVAQINWLWVVMFAVPGALLSILLIKFVKFELNQEDNQIYLQRDKRIIYVILLLIPFKFSLRYIFQEMPELELNMYLFIMGMATLSVWTVLTYTNFLQVKKERDLAQHQGRGQFHEPTGG